MPTPATNAIALTVLVYYTAKLSGAHLNPALTTTFALLGYTNPVEVVVYWIAQVAGCIVGALWLAVLVPGLGVGSANWPAVSLSPTAAHLSGCFVPSPSIGGVAVLGWEAICTFCFILPIFSVVWYTQSKSGYGNTGPLIVGLSLYSAASVAAPWTGAALNPARAIASRIVFGCDPATSYTGYYVAGEMIGAAIVPIAIAPWYGMSWSVMRQIHERAYSYSVPQSEAQMQMQMQMQMQNHDSEKEYHTGVSPVRNKMSIDEQAEADAEAVRNEYVTTNALRAAAGECRRSADVRQQPLNGPANVRGGRRSVDVRQLPGRHGDGNDIEPAPETLGEDKDTYGRPRQRRASNVTFSIPAELEVAYAAAAMSQIGAADRPSAGRSSGALFPPENKYICAPFAVTVSRKLGLRVGSPASGEYQQQQQHQQQQQQQHQLHYPNRDSNFSPLRSSVRPSTMDQPHSPHGDARIIEIGGAESSDGSSVAAVAAALSVPGKDEAHPEGDAAV
jgi:glycerol uptake facilitator-like aquaporin